jgi:sigma-B regulation protein RsbU (phosphoserine phosphatase)
VTQTDQDFFRTLIEDRREGFMEWLSAASRQERGNGGHHVVLQNLERALNQIKSDDFGTCIECEGAMEKELLTSSPEREVCLDCMNESQKRQLEDDLRVTQEMNQAMLPRLAPEIGPWDIGIHYRPNRILSGDFYDVIRRSPDTVALAMGDVSGKGLPAGLLRASLQATVRTLSHQSIAPADLLEKTSLHLFETSDPNRFASVFYGLLQEDRGTLIYANGGHLPPLLRRASGDWEVLGATGTVLGILEGSRYREATCTIEPGDLLVLFTDGVTEAEDPSGKFFDERNLIEAVNCLAAQQAQEIADGVADELDRFSLAPPNDDRTLVVLRRTAIS